ncbi:MAG: hypothetical protein HKM24_02230, partial [Gammaproteobacteria bacterium]|nr:hypothetical protein [Gammaproteobacteria bacterium]
MNWFLAWADPWIWFVVSGLVLLLALFGTSPCFVTPEDNTLSELIMARFRLLIWTALVAVLVIFPIGVYLIGFGFFGGDTTFLVITEALLSGLAKTWNLVIGAGIVGWGLSFLWARYVV